MLFACLLRYENMSCENIRYIYIRCLNEDNYARSESKVFEKLYVEKLLNYATAKLI